MRDIIEYIDNEITDCIPQAFAFGLCHLVEDDNGIYPSTLKSQAEKVTPDDRYEFLFYHRLLTGNPEPSEDLSFGKHKTIMNTQSIRTVIFEHIDCDLSLIDDFINALPDTFELEYSPQIYKMLSVSESLSLNRDSNAVWSDEYGESYKDKYAKVWNIYALEWQVKYIRCNNCL